MERLLSQHFAYCARTLKEYSKHLDLPNHGDIKGAAREGLIDAFMRNNLPTNTFYSTGEIVDCNDQRSGQVDIIIQSSNSPRMHLFNTINLALADSVLGAIEVKSNLTTTSTWESNSHLKTALDTTKKIKSLERAYKITGVKEQGEVELSKIPCFIFAYTGPTVDTLIEKLNSYGKHHEIEQGEYWPEVITVLDKGYYLIKNDGWLISKFDPQYNCSKNICGDECLMGMFVYLCQIIEASNNRFTPTLFNRYFRNL